MKYNDRHTRLLNHKYESREAPNQQDIYRNKIIKQFSKKAIDVGIDPDWWELVSKSDRYSLYCHFNYLKNFNEKDTTTLYEFITNNKNIVTVDEVKLRNIKLNRILS